MACWTHSVTAELSDQYLIGSRAVAAEASAATAAVAPADAAAATLPADLSQQSFNQHIRNPQNLARACL